jgi:response regulator RpfG family c-di-GMP phosphodiesterase
MKDNGLLQAVELASAPLQRPTHSAPRILVVDDSRDFRLLYADVLARPGYHVDAAEDGVAARKALRVNNYNLLITEHNLPTLTGVELVRTLRAARMAVPVIMAAARLPVCMNWPETPCFNRWPCCQSLSTSASCWKR